MGAAEIKKETDAQRAGARRVSQEEKKGKSAEPAGRVEDMQIPAPVSQGGAWVTRFSMRPQGEAPRHRSSRFELRGRPQEPKMPVTCFLARSRTPGVGAGAAWAFSRKARNRARNALHGNGPGGRADAQPLPQKKAAVTTKPSGPWTSVTAGNRVRSLLDLQTVGWLRREDWSLPQELGDTYEISVYDTRLEPGDLLALAAELGAPSRKVIGGDALTNPTLEYAEALGQRVRRWGGVVGPEHLLAPPRPHLNQWVERVQQQLPLEAPGTTITLLC